MEFYAASKGNISPADMELFYRIQVILIEMPDIVFDPTERDWDHCKNQISCHLICRALAQHFDAEVGDGFFVRGYQHSWLIPASKSSIIDVYPVAGASSFIVANDPASPWTKLYITSDKLDHKFMTRQFRDRLEQTTKVVGEIIKKLGYKLGY